MALSRNGFAGWLPATVVFKGKKEYTGRVQQCLHFWIISALRKLARANPHAAARSFSMPYANNNGVRVHYEVEGSGPPLVLQHGSTSNIQSWYQNGYVEPLKPHYQLILMDARGHGASDKPHDSVSYALPLRVSDTGPIPTFVSPGAK